MRQKSGFKKFFGNYALVLLPILGVIGGLALGEAMVNVMRENQRQWEEFMSSHGGCWQTGAYDVSTDLVPMWGVDSNGYPQIVSWMPDTTYTYHWLCKDGYTFKR